MKISQKKLTYHDGTGHLQRELNMLSPDYISLEERSVRDLLNYAHQYAKMLKFYDTTDNQVQDWANFIKKEEIEDILAFIDAPEIFQSDPLKLSKLSKPHLILFISFLQILEKHVKPQLNTFTKRHLDFYYHEALGLDRKQPVPDQVSVMFKLNKNIPQHLLPAGTILNAGKDIQGNELHYRTDQDLIINQACIESLKKIFIQKEIIGLKEARFKNQSNSDKNSGNGFIDLFRLALGRPNPGDTLQDFKFKNISRKVDIELLAGENNSIGLYGELRFVNTDLYMSIFDFRRIMLTRKELQDIQDIPENQPLIQSKWDIINYLLKQAAKRKNGEEIEGFADPKNFLQNLQEAVSPSFSAIEGVSDIDTYHSKLKAIESFFFMPAEDFIYVMGIHAKHTDASYNEWNSVYQIMEKAHERMIINQRKNELKEKRTENADDPDKGFLHMFSWALGTFNEEQSGYVLPDFPVGMNNLDEVNDNLESDNDAKRNEALHYVEDRLFLEQENFSKLISIRQKDNPAPEEWDQLYTFVELAWRKKYKTIVPAPEMIVWKNIYTASDARKVTADQIMEKDESHQRWKTFGAPYGITSEEGLRLASIGFALSSPVLALQEGEREITLTLDCKDPFEEGKLADYLKPENAELLNDLQPFQFFLSTEEEWIEIENVDVRIGTYLVSSVGKPVSGAIYNPEENQITSNTDCFTLNDFGGYVVGDDGSIYQIEAISNAQTVKVVPKGSLDLHEGFKKYKVNEVFSHALRFKFTLTKREAPIQPLKGLDKDSRIKSSWPVLKVLLRDIPGAHEEYTKHYPLFQDLKIKDACINVDVKGLEEFVIQNDQGVLNAKSPFEPFGDTPGLGNRFYFAHPEVSYKKLESLRLNVEWMDLPDSLNTHYKSYYEVLGDTNPITNNNSFKTLVKLYDNRDLLDIQELPLFNHMNISNISDKIDSSSYTYNANTDIKIDKQVLNWDRYFQLELNKLDFLHRKYNEVLSANTIKKANDDEYTLKIINEPYTPKVKKMTIDYTASAHIQLDGDNSEQFIHIHPFGFEDVQEKQAYLLPQYHDEGALFIGIEGLKPLQQLSVLFQLAEGSGDPELKSPGINWSYLDENQWKDLSENIITETTHGLLTSGIIAFDIPVMKNADQTFFSDSLYWLKASISHNTYAIPDTITIGTQAVTATFKDQENAPEHYQKPLAPESITKLANPVPEVKSVKQPFTSVKGKSKEKDQAFYTRVSERIRHKSRALSIWHYERMILEQFPDIYKVKCIPAQSGNDPDNLGKVDIIVIPDIRGRVPFNPFEPKVSNGYLAEIQEYIEHFIPSEASVNVRNAKYVPVKIKFNAKFKKGYELGYYKKELIREIKQYLSPWAYDKGADIPIGGEIHANILLNFIEERPYVDYISKIKLFIGFKSGYSDANFDFKAAQLIGKGQENVAYAPSPDAILTSSIQHEIGLISDIEGYKEEEYIGIGYMHIALDFIVG